MGMGRLMEIGHRCQTILHVLPLILFAPPSGRVASSFFVLILCVYYRRQSAYKSRHFTCSRSIREVRGERRVKGLGNLVSNTDNGREDTVHTCQLRTWAEAD